MSYLFIDPASKSMGFAEFSNSGKLLGHWTISVSKKDEKLIFWKRFIILEKQIDALFKHKKFDGVLIEQMSGKTHFLVKWVVGGLVWYFMKRTKFIKQISVSAWKAEFGLKIRDKGEKINLTFKKVCGNLKVNSDDEVEAILMGVGFFRTGGYRKKKKRR